ncbi:hypothetical protein [Rickettsia sp. TH2014]|uniref:hypothetical protein n=1 Tax=Rickettsia sp. TH2014 TaxID=1967503 RepID=UPI001C474107|nr:hypothetical protein [Rickettsia sp. TH2014]
MILWGILPKNRHCERLKASPSWIPESSLREAKRRGNLVTSPEIASANYFVILLAMTALVSMQARPPRNDDKNIGVK